MIYRICHLVLSIFFVFQVSAQDLDPRAYVQVPVHTTTIIPGFAYSYGGVVSDPTLPIQNLKADVETISLGIAHSFNFFGLSSQALVALPYSWAQLTGEVDSVQQSRDLSGFSDMRIRFSFLFLGAPAVTLTEYMKNHSRKTILGASINMVVPTGQFFSDKLINLGTNRWAIRPELALSQPFGKRMLLDVYAGVWFFTNNNSFYPGESVRSQEPMGAFQCHLSYNINPKTWIGINTTFYTGGTSSINDKVNDDRQSNVRIGISGVFPTGKFSAMKISVSKGAIVRIGQNFTTFSLGWTRSWFAGVKKKK